MEELIAKTKEMIDIQVEKNQIFVFGRPFDQCQKVYFSTNENIHGYLSQLNFYNKTNALCVLGSGDLVFNLAFYGIQKMDTFDTNQLTEYYALGIKKAAILAFSYEEYIDFLEIVRNMNYSNNKINDYLNALFPYMDKKYQIFWNEILEYNYFAQKYKKTYLPLFGMLLINPILLQTNQFFNSYFANAENYEKTKRNLEQTTISFKPGNAFYINELYPNTYDFIFLSNILDYFCESWGYDWTYPKLEEYTRKIESLMKKEGVCGLAYIHHYLVHRDSGVTKRVYPIVGSKVKTSQINEILSFPHSDLDHKIMNVNDGLILVRKR